MGDVQHGGIRQGFLQLLQLGDHRLTQLCIQGGKWFIQKQHPGPNCQRACNGHALLLTAGQLAWITVGIAGHAHHRQRFVYTRRDVAGFGSTCPQTEGNVVSHAHMRKQCIGLHNYADSSFRGR